jgi:ribosomal protein S8E
LEFFIEIGLNVETEAAEMVGRMTSSASVEDGVAATVTTAPEIDETVVVPREAPLELL